MERLELPGGALATVLLRGFGPLRWAYVPRGPLPAGPGALAALAAWARDRSLARLRVEPQALESFTAELRARGFRPASALHPRHTLLVPLAADEEMLAGFKSKHRYNVRLAARRGVTVESGTDADELRRQTEKTAARHGISLPRVDFYRRRLELLDWCRVYIARHEGVAIAAIMVARFGGRAYYLFGGGDHQHRQLMAPYALQWQAMRDARSAGCADYDMWGLPPAPDPSHPWFGLWQFKTGFGGEAVTYCGAWDLVLSPAGNRLARLAAGAQIAARHLRR